MSKEIVKTEAELAMGREINFLIGLFKDVNPTYTELFGRKVQRSAIERLLNNKNIGREKLEEILNVLAATNQMRYAPVITTPLQLESKLGSLMAFIQREQGEISKRKIIKIQ